VSAAAQASAAASAGRDLQRVYVWEAPVRITHWLIFFSILALSVTGFLIGRPVINPAGEARMHHVMATVKIVHFYSGIVFTTSILARLIWMLTGNVYSRWHQFVPVDARRRRGVLGTLRFYTFIDRNAPPFVGHNPVAGLSYTAIFGLYFLVTATGFALYSVGAPVGSPFRKLQWLIPLFGGLPWARWIHHAIMWLLLGFAVHHVYSALLMSHVEKNACLESIFSGYKFFPRHELEEERAFNARHHRGARG